MPPESSERPGSGSQSREGDLRFGMRTARRHEAIAEITDIPPTLLSENLAQCPGQLSEPSRVTCHRDREREFPKVRSTVAKEGESSATIL